MKDQSPKIPVVMDTDIGTDIDDTIALAAVLGSPILHLVGISTVYVDAPLRANIARCLLELAGINDVPVWAGESMPIRPLPARADQGAWEWHEGRGILYDKVSLEEQEVRQGNRPIRRPYLSGESDTPERLAQLAGEHPNLTVVSIGPLTNIARTIMLHPEFETLVGGIILMGGCFRDDVTEPQFEHNFACDPGAAEIVFSSSIPLTVVGFDASEFCYLVHDRVSPLCASHTPFSAALNGLIDIYFDVKGRWRTSMHDPVTIALAEDAGIGTMETTEVSIDPATGNTSLERFPGSITRPVLLLRNVPPERWDAFIYQRLSLVCDYLHR